MKRTPTYACRHSDANAPHRARAATFGERVSGCALLASELVEFPICRVGERRTRTAR
jgi:hypothetical protein